MASQGLRRFTSAARKYGACSEIFAQRMQGISLPGSVSLSRNVGSFVDPWSSADPSVEPPDEQTTLDHNRQKLFGGMEGDPKKGLADDVRRHPFGGIMAGCVGHDEDRGITYWEYDLIGGAVYNNGQNALLSNATKNEIYKKHMDDPDRWSIEALALHFRIRQQRVMAIIGLKELEFKEYGDLKEEDFNNLSEDVQSAMAPFGAREDSAGNKIELTEAQEKKRWSNYCDWLETEVYGATATRGSGERHHVSVPTYPKFEEIPLEDAKKYVGAEWDVSRINRLYTQKEDRQMIKEFKENFLLNLGKIGVSLQRTSRKGYTKSPPKRDMGLTVTPLGKDHQDPYVAEPDGTQRALSEDELLNWQRKNRWAVRRMVQHRVREREARADQKLNEVESQVDEVAADAETPNDHEK